MAGGSSCNYFNEISRHLADRFSISNHHNIILSKCYRFPTPLHSFPSAKRRIFLVLWGFDFHRALGQMLTVTNLWRIAHNLIHIFNLSILIIILHHMHLVFTTFPILPSKNVKYSISNAIILICKDIVQTEFFQHREKIHFS